MQNKGFWLPFHPPLHALAWVERRRVERGILGQGGTHLCLASPQLTRCFLQSETIWYKLKLSLLGCKGGGDLCQKVQNLCYFKLYDLMVDKDHHKKREECSMSQSSIKFWLASVLNGYLTLEWWNHVKVMKLISLRVYTIWGQVLPKPQSQKWQ